jgi:hypothetical protein
MTYVEFIQDWLDAAKHRTFTLRLGYDAFTSNNGPIFSVVYTYVEIHIGGFLDKISDPDPDIPMSVVDAQSGRKFLIYGGA